MRLRNRRRLRLPARLRKDEEEGYFEDGGQGNEDEENWIPDIPDEMDLIELELVAEAEKGSESEAEQHRNEVDGNDEENDIIDI